MNQVQLQSLREVLQAIVFQPFELLVKRWNWKSALLSSIIRAAIFLLANLTAGRRAAVAAMLTEFVYRALTSGFFASLTQAFRHVTPAWHGTLAAVILVPFVSHSLELLVHLLRGTPRLGLSIAFSVSFTAVSTAYNLFAMRQGTLVVGEDARTFSDDLKQTPRILLGFFQSSLASLTRLFAITTGNRIAGRTASGRGEH